MKKRTGGIALQLSIILTTVDTWEIGSNFVNNIKIKYH